MYIQKIQDGKATLALTRKEWERIGGEAQWHSAVASTHSVVKTASLLDYFRGNKNLRQVQKGAQTILEAIAQVESALQSAKSVSIPDGQGRIINLTGLLPDFAKFEQSVASAKTQATQLVQGAKAGIIVAPPGTAPRNARPKTPGQRAPATTQPTQPAATQPQPTQPTVLPGVGAPGAPSATAQPAFDLSAWGKTTDGQQVLNAMATKDPALAAALKAAQLIP